MCAAVVLCRSGGQGAWHVVIVARTGTRLAAGDRDVAVGIGARHVGGKVEEFQLVSCSDCPDPFRRAHSLYSKEPVQLREGFMFRTCASPSAAAAAAAAPVLAP